MFEAGAKVSMHAYFIYPYITYYMLGIVPSDLQKITHLVTITSLLGCREFVVYLTIFTSIDSLGFSLNASFFVISDYLGKILRSFCYALTVICTFIITTNDIVICLHVSFPSRL